MCRYPIELTLLSRFLSAAKADDWGRSIKRPYRHLYKCGYRSGSSSWSRRSDSMSTTNEGHTKKGKPSHM
jgi:hypothetical protein